MKLKDSQTYLNLARAYAAECSARSRYEFCEYGFRYNGYEAIATLIDRIAYQEFNHARMLYMNIQDGEMKQVNNIDVCASLPFKEKWDLLTNLKLLSEDELDEAKAYEEFAKVAHKEGFKEIAHLFEMIREVEIRHAKVFEELYKQILHDKLSLNEGMLFENAIAQCLVANGHKLFFYTHYNADKHRNDMEIDFILSNNSKLKPKLYPIEVKSGKRYTTDSLNAFVEKYRSRIGKAYVVHPKNLTVKGDIVCIPSYMAIFL